MQPILLEKRKELEDLCRRFQVARLEAFGSAASGTFNSQTSDLDFLVTFRPEAESRLAELFLDMIAALRELFHRDIDLVLERSIRNPYFRKVVDRSRVPLYAA